MKATHLLLVIFPFLLFGCDSLPEKVDKEPNDTEEEVNTATATADTSGFETTELEVSKDEEDEPVNEYMTDELAPIRANFKRINSTENWQEIKVHELFETTEGGELKYYYSDQGLEKVIRRDYGETQQRIVEYYLLDAALSFVFEKYLAYNRPIYWDSTQMVANNDTEVFDLEQAEVIEDRSYFMDGKLVHLISSGDCGAPFAEEYLREEEKRLKQSFEEILKIAEGN